MTRWRFDKVKRWEGSVAIACAVLAVVMLVLSIEQFVTIGSMGAAPLIIAISLAGFSVHYASVWSQKRWERRDRRRRHQGG